MNTALIRIHENQIARNIVQSALDVHKALGPGLLENSYDVCLTYKLRQMGLIVEPQLALPLIFEGVKLPAGYRVDQMVEGKVIFEVKSVEGLNELLLAQILTYLKLSHYKLGLLINFNTVLLKDGIRRVINGIL